MGVPCLTHSLVEDSLRMSAESHCSLFSFCISIAGCRPPVDQELIPSSRVNSNRDKMEISATPGVFQKTYSMLLESYQLGFYERTSPFDW